MVKQWLTAKVYSGLNIEMVNLSRWSLIVYYYTWFKMTDIKISIFKMMFKIINEFSLFQNQKSIKRVHY